MARFIFDDYARTTFSVSTNMGDNSVICPQQMDELIGYLKSPGSGPDSATSFEEHTEARTGDAERAAGRRHPRPGAQSHSMRMGRSRDLRNPQLGCDVGVRSILTTLQTNLMF